MRAGDREEVFVCNEAQAGLTTSGDERVWLSSVLFGVDSFQDVLVDLEAQRSNERSSGLCVNTINKGNTLSMKSQGAYPHLFHFFISKTISLYCTNTGSLRLNFLKLVLVRKVRG
jgi:hypothetical protein